VPTYLQTAVSWATVHVDRKSHHNCETMFGEVPKEIHKTFVVRDASFTAFSYAHNAQGFSPVFRLRYRFYKESWEILGKPSVRESKTTLIPWKRGLWKFKYGKMWGGPSMSKKVQISNVCTETHQTCYSC